MDFSLLRFESHPVGQWELQPTCSPAIRRLMFRRLRRKAVADGIGCHSPTWDVGCCSGNAQGIEVALSGGALWGPPAALWAFGAFVAGVLQRPFWKIDRLCICHAPCSWYLGLESVSQLAFPLPPFRPCTEI